MYQPKYDITNIILKNISHIEAAREMIENAALVPAWEAKFRKDAIIRTVHYGTHLEGNLLSREQVEEVVEEKEEMVKFPPARFAKASARRAGEAGLNGQMASTSGVIAKPAFAGGFGVARERDIQEVLNYREVLEFIDKRGIPLEATYGRVRTSYVPYTLEDLQKIHSLVTRKILTEEDQGKLRKVQVIIRNQASGEVIYRPPAAMAVPMQLADFLEWINSPQSRLEDHPILRAGITHWELVRIHPFTDGNGRTARAMTLLVLFQEGYDVKRFFSIEQYYDQNPHDYYEALGSVVKHVDGDMTEWLEYFTDGLAIELARVKDRVVTLSRDKKLKGKLGRQVALSERQIKILEYMEVNNGILTSKEMANVYSMVSRDTIVRDMNDLLTKKVVKKVGSTKGARYILRE